jgi:GT2 family glycosyltransferase
MLPNLIIPTLTRYDLLQKMLNSIDYPVKQIIILDNGDKLQAGNSKVKGGLVRTIPLPSNLGVATTWNLGIKMLPHEKMWFFASDDIQFEPGTLEKWHLASSPDTLTVSDDHPHYQFFSLGENVLRKVGLFDEGLYPSNFEDDDYNRRMKNLGLELNKVNLPHTHLKIGTAKTNKEIFDKNVETFYKNKAYYESKVEAKDFSAGGWNLDTRRDNSWDTVL